MRKYKIVTMLWQDHTHFDRSKLFDRPEDEINPTLSVGFIYKETKRYYILVSDIEKYQERDDVTYTVIFKPIIGLKEYGEIELEAPRTI